jgi:hypothetical protein
MSRDEIHLAFNNNLPVKIIGIKGWITEINISTWSTTSSNSMETLSVTIELENLTTRELAEKDFEIVALWKEKEIEMTNKNDKIVELIKAYLDGKTLQPTVHHPSLESLITTVIAHPDSFKIKPETKKVYTRTWEYLGAL